jgi:hypothetical protein
MPTVYQNGFPLVVTRRYFMLIETSKDLLYIILTFAVLWFVIFFSWILFYIIMICRQAHKMISVFRTRVEQISQAAEKIKVKFENSSAYLGLIAQAVEKMVGFFVERKGAKKKK